MEWGHNRGFLHRSPSLLMLQKLCSLKWADYMKIQFPSQCIFPTVEQWGYGLHGKVTFPIAYTKCKQIVALHYGSEYMRVKIGNHTLDGFSLDVENNASGADAHWIAVGA